MSPLANNVRPTSFSEVVNQEHLIGTNGIITKMIEANKLSSFILSGGPGSGKTTIALLVANKFENYFFFNASTDKKTDLVKIITTNSLPLILIVDEIHRMKTDTQDYLLRFLENGQVIMIGLTTHNPYYKVNPAIRSRALLLKINELTQKDIIIIIKNAIKKLGYLHSIDEDAIKYIARAGANEARTALNILEQALLLDKDITVQDLEKLSIDPNLKLDAFDDYHYQLLSGLQKSLRGSDLDAALYYAAKLIIAGDLDSLVRRLLVIVYEDVSIANPELCSRVYNALNAALMVGLPEARIMIANVVTEIALSPKSNAAYVGLDNAIAMIKQEAIDLDIPLHLKNENLYKYPHNYPYAMVKQNYLPNKIKDLKFASFMGLSSKELEYKQKYEKINKLIK